jgi:hypothetical protein
MDAKLKRRVRSVLKRARALLSDRSKWTRFTAARDKDGVEVTSRSPKAVCWCAFGALCRVTRGPDGPRGGAISVCERHIARAALDLGQSYADALHVPTWNDVAARTYDEVIAAFDKAIADL